MRPSNAGPIIAAFVLLGLCTAASATCPPALVEGFQKTVTARSLEAAREAEDKLGSTAGCTAEDLTARDRLEALEVELVGDASTPDAIRQDALDDVQANGRSWQNAVLLADRFLTQHRPLDAIKAYDRAIALAGPSSVISEAQRSALVLKAGAAKLLASNDDEGRKAAHFARSFRGADGVLGGIYSRPTRGLAPVKIPLPISFTSGTSTFTENGEQAAAELVDALRQQKPGRITLVGHTDPRGSDDYNMRLSLARARKVADYVRRSLARDAIRIDMKLIAKGKSEPFDAAVLPYKAAEDELWALDRRVDLVR